MGEAYNYAADIEEALWLSNDDKQRLREFVTRSLAAIETSRVAACRWYNLACKHRRSQTALQQAAKPPEER